MPLIELENVCVRYRDFTALEGVSCRISGGAVGLLGPNGAGKSTLMKTLLGYNRASAGTVRVFDLEMPARALEVRHRLGYMPEREVVSPKVSAVSFLTYCGQLFGMSRVDARERAHAVLNYVGLGENRYRRMDTYSTGMLQRTKLAQALIHDPRLLLLDEPTNGLDPDSRVEMLELITEVVRAREVTVLLSTHLLPDIQHVCDHVMIINDGKILREGTLSELTAHLERQYEIRLNAPSAAYWGRLSALGAAWTDQHDGTVVVTLPDGVAPRALFEAALAEDRQIREFRTARQRLEDVFMSIVGRKATTAARRE